MPAGPVFPCQAVPDDPRLARLLGLYPQVQPGKWMQRVKILGGVLTAAQWRALAAIQRRFTPDTALHLTTRQDVELHDLTAEQVPAVQRELHEAGLTTVGACGDTVRNVTVCPCSGILRDRPDLTDLARGVRRALEAEDGVFALPRKFKISLSACPDACAQPWINDLGFVAERQDGSWGFRVIAGGSLGPRPGTGILLFERISPAEVPPCAVAAMRVFAAHGDRQNRARARLRHVRERVGDDAFRAMLAEAFRTVRQERAWPEVELRAPADGFGAKAELSFPNGDVTGAAAEAIADLAGRDDLRVRVSNAHRVPVFGRDGSSVRGAVDAFASLRDAAKPQASVVACPGKRWCQRGLTDTNGLADRIRRELSTRAGWAGAVCISGCPNNCAQSAVADVGLVGVLVSEGGRKREAYNLLTGGGMGRNDKLATQAGQKLSADEVIEHIRGVR